MSSSSVLRGTPEIVHGKTTCCRSIDHLSGQGLLDRTARSDTMIEKRHKPSELLAGVMIILIFAAVLLASMLVTERESEPTLGSDESDTEPEPEPTSIDIHIYNDGPDGYVWLSIDGNDVASKYLPYGEFFSWTYSPPDNDEHLIGAYHNDIVGVDYEYARLGDSVWLQVG